MRAVFAWWHKRVRQGATDELHEIVRTARGWVRVAARTNDSRELQESLECMLDLIHEYATQVLSAGTVDTVPSLYWRNKKEELRNPLYIQAQDEERASDTSGRRRGWFIAVIHTTSAIFVVFRRLG